MMEEETLNNFELDEIERRMLKDKTYQFEQNSQEFFRDYYKKCFPYKKIFNWLSYSRTTKSGKSIGSDYFNRREISYMVKSTTVDNEEFCMRHLCYNNAKEFEAEVQRLNPIRIDIGPVCDIIPSKSQDTTAQKPIAIEREFVIDIDMTDYDNIRTCCKGKTICESCWKYLTAAYEVLKESLEKDFGFKHILWVFSGRRGIHAWVCDERARIMENSVRSGISSYLNISVSNDNIDSFVIPAVNKNPNYRLFQRSFNILKGKFEDFVVKEQAFFVFEKNVDHVLKVLERIAKKKADNLEIMDKISKLKGNIRNIYQEKLSYFDQNVTRAYNGERSEFEGEISSEIYHQILKVCDSDRNGEEINSSFLMEIVIGLMYPKIDFHVSAQTNHLLKCPFNIHSGTGLLSVPIDDFRKFEISDVPYVQDVIKFYDENNGDFHPKFERFLNSFDGFCKKLLESEVFMREKLERMNGNEEMF